jgi:CRISPR/Cas system-associated exonuclease Cas4 (RecB family)
MLRLEKAFELKIEDGEAKSNGRETGFSLNEVKELLINTAKKIAFDYEHEFYPTDNENNCRFCGYKFYCPKWSED